MSQNRRDEMRQLPDKIDGQILRKYPNAGFYTEMDGEWLKTVRITPEKYVQIYMYAPADGFYGLYTSYYPNGQKQESYHFLGSVKIGVSKTYDERGGIAETIDEEAKFEDIKKEDIVAFLENEHWMNRKTGENRIVNHVLPLDGNFYYEITNAIHIRFIPKDIENNASWIIFIPGDMNRDWNETTYSIDGRTGKVTEKTRSAPILF